MRATIGTVIQPEWYEEKVDYVTASVMELLGEYDFVFLLFWVVCGFFFMFMEKNQESGKKPYVMAGILSLLIPLAQVARDFKTLSVCFGSFVNILKTVLSVAGFFFFFLALISYLTGLLLKKNFVNKESKFFSGNVFLKAFLVILLLYLPIVFLSFPGNLNYDTIGQIQQVLGDAPYSAHHPLLVTFLIGGTVKAVMALTGSMELGLFVYSILQTLMLATALAYSVSYLAGQRTNPVLLTILLAVYCITPVYSNITSTAIKDVPFMAMVVTYVVMTANLIDNPVKIKKPAFFIPYILVQMGAILFRNNGLYLILFLGIGLWIYLRKQYDTGSRITSLLVIFLVSVALSLGTNATLKAATDAKPVSKGEMLSLPMQVAARYYIAYSEELKPGEYETLCAVLGDADEALKRYNPDLADFVKARFNKEASNKDIVNFLILTGKFTLRHPGVCFDGFFVHTYGWFVPNVSNEKRYETLEEDEFPIHSGSLMDKVLVYFYRFMNRISFLGALENIGVMVWLYAFLDRYQRISCNTKYRIFGIMIITALLICMAAPAFFEHPRYGFPVLFVVPFLFILTIGEQKEERD